MDKLSKKLIFKKIDATDSDIQILYNLLTKRRYGISHKKIPSYDEHHRFVRNHPYRVWFLILVEDVCIGNFYLTNDNGIGLFLIDGFNCYSFPVIDRILLKYKPLKEKKSIRPPYFYINVATSDGVMNKELTDLGFEKIQTTYRVIC